MNSKTAKAVDKALVRAEKELARLAVLFADIRADVRKHYPPKKTK